MSTARHLTPVAAGVTPWGVLRDDDRVAVVGLSGSGKSYFARRLVSPASRLVIWDVCGEYADAAEPVTLAELLEAPELLLGDRVALAVRPGTEDEEELAEETAALVSLVRRAGRCLLVLEEVGDYGKAAERTLSKLARNGRHAGVACVFVTQAAVEIPKSARRQLTRVFSFIQTDPEDLEALRKRCGDAFVERVTAWRPGDPPAAWTLPTFHESECRP